MVNKPKNRDRDRRGKRMKENKKFRGAITNYKELGELLRQLRQENKFTQEDVCARFDMLQPTLSKIENGIYKVDFLFCMNFFQLYGVEDLSEYIFDYEAEKDEDMD